MTGPRSDTAAALMSIRVVDLATGDNGDVSVTIAASAAVGGSR